MAIFDAKKRTARRAARRDYLRGIWESYQRGRSSRVASRQAGKSTRVQSRQWGKAMKKGGGTQDKNFLDLLGGSSNGGVSTTSPSILDSPYFWPVVLVGFGALVLRGGDKKKRKR